MLEIFCLPKYIMFRGIMGSRSRSRSHSPNGRESGRNRHRSSRRSSSGSRSRSHTPDRKISDSRPSTRDEEIRRSRSPARSGAGKRSDSRSVSPDDSEHDSIRLVWREVKKDKDNFDIWMNALTVIEQVNEISSSRAIYDRFLEKYPYCYGFWKKYADFERRNNMFAEAVKVWERSIVAIPLSVDLWQGFLGFMRELAPTSETGHHKLREQYDRALSIAGAEYNSDRLWNEAIAWEESRGNWQRVAAIYDKVLQTPTAMFKSHYERYETIINMYEPDILLSNEEYDEIFTLMKKHINLGIDQIVTEEAVADDVLPSVTTDEASDVKPRLTKRKKHHPEALAFFRAEILARRRRWHENTAALISARILFEEQIKRPYFHVKPLEKCQLKNWRQYLDFEIEEGNDNRICILFERCLIACALYDDFWLKYARWSSKKSGKSSVKDIYKRAAVHCSKSVNIALASSAYEELQGEFAVALHLLDKFDSHHPGYAAIEMRRIGIYRRRAERASVPDYSEVTQRWEALIHAPTTTRRMSSFYSIKLARFHLKSRGDRRLAEKVLKRALDRDMDNLQLHLQMIDLAYTDPEFSQTRVLAAFSEALRSKLPDEDRMRLSQRKLDFLEDISYDIDLLQEHHELHHVLLQEVDNPQLTTRKRRRQSPPPSERDRRDRDRDDYRRRGSRRDDDRGGYSSRRDDRGGGDYGGGYGQSQGYYQNNVYPVQQDGFVQQMNYGGFSGQVYF